MLRSRVLVLSRARHEHRRRNRKVRKLFQNLRFVAPQLRRQMRYEMARINRDFASFFPVIIHDHPELFFSERQQSKDQIERTSPVQTQPGLDKFQPVQLLLPLELLLRSVSFQPCAL